MQKITQGAENDFNQSSEYFLNDINLLNRHELAKPPIEAYLFIPNTVQRIEYDEKNKKRTLRRIFELKNESFLDYEETKLHELEQEIINYNEKNKKDKLLLPEGFKQYEKRRFLQATGFNCSKTILLLKSNIEFLTKSLPPKMTSKVVELLNSGFMYIHGRDNNYRPIMVLNAEYYMKLKEKYVFDNWVQAVIFIMEYMVEHLLIPGQVENWNIITDVKGVSVIFLPSDLKKIMNLLQSNYRCRLYVNFIIGMGALLRGVWKIIKGMLDETTVRKVRILEDSKLSQIFEIINEDQVERKYGGRAQNVIPGMNNCFPPIMSSTNYLTTNLNKETHLISEGQYKQMHLENKLSVTNDFFLNKWREEEATINLEKKSEEANKENNEGMDKALQAQILSDNSSYGRKMRQSKIKIINNSLRDINFIQQEYDTSTRSLINEFKRVIGKPENGKTCEFHLKKHLCNRTPEILQIKDNSFIADKKPKFTSKEESTNFNRIKEPDENIDFLPVKSNKEKIQDADIFTNFHPNSNDQISSSKGNNNQEEVMLDDKTVKAFCKSDGCLLI